MVKWTRVAALSLGAALVAGSVSAQGFEGVVTYQITGHGGQKTELAMTIKGGLIRTDMSGEGHQMAMIMDADAQKMTMIMPEQKMYMTTDMKAMSERWKGMYDSLAPKITSLGTSETIAGRKCENYQVESNGKKTDLCVAKGMGTFMMPRGPMGRGPASDVAALNSEAYGKYFKDGFFPLRVMDLEEKRVVMEATRVEPKPIAASEFQVPAGFTQMNMPNMGPRP